ncbi:acyl-CoA N-acyltransferase [Chaetomium fimeti]|uniref:Acyl-CoA N-acyltransferase n=1 Tax=Chaetomium fimeti TaxID=1854472 RepID=A0AAE0LMJ4_9PEZI|nr:acyl-CoA N-acyltransferase [Chaetomium fimeti]
MPGHLKRKRPSGGPEPSAATKTTVATVSAPVTSRRATRQSSIPPLPVPEDPEPRRRRRRQQQKQQQQQHADGDANSHPTEISPPSLSPRGKENMHVHMLTEQPVRAQQLPKTSTRMTRHSVIQDMSASARPSRSNIHLAKSPAISSPTRTTAMAPSDITQRPTTPSRFGPSTGRSRNQSVSTPINPQSVSLGRNKPIIMATSVAQPGQNSTSNPNRTPNNAARGTDSAARPDRNIDKVVLGDICFPAWYPSYYGKELLGGVSSNSTKSGKGTKSNGSLAASLSNQESKDDINGTTAHGRRDRDSHPPMLNRLYVCPRCFKYSKELVTWWEHVRWCEQQGYLPGNKIYTHPKGKRTVMVPSGPAPKQGRGKRGSVGQRMVQEVVQDEGEWSIREVDGEDDVLFCQNLSLFAKLFLDNKSVFFDVTGFKYFLLVHTPPPPHPSSTHTAPTATDPEITAPHNTGTNRGQIVGFFSKEKMSWDNNNLACILVFPPWQRKGLGSLLMGISYEISRREGVLGGPEKPISDLGKRGYKHFWAGEICRWLLTLSPHTTTVTTTTTASADGDEEAPAARSDPEIVVDVEACSQATWIAPEDCLGVLREMGLAEDAGTGPPPVSRTAARTTAAPDNQKKEELAPAAAATATTTTLAPPPNTGGAAEAASPAPPVPEAAAAADQVVVRRVRISQAAVRAWVAANRVSLERACDPDGFVEGYALKGRAAASEEPV